jgi:hypothetical protein
MVTRKITAKGRRPGADPRTPKIRHPRGVPIMAAEAESEQEPDRPFEEGARDTVDVDLRHRMISEAAYALYMERGYADGYELDDWLAAEAAVDHLLLNPKS